jgi:hypothetical protein
MEYGKNNYDNNINMNNNNTFNKINNNIPVLSNTKRLLVSKCLDISLKSYISYLYIIC